MHSSLLIVERMEFSASTGLTRNIEALVEMGETLNPLFLATVEATEEAILNALCKAETMTGRAGHILHALPLESLGELLG